MRLHKDAVLTTSLIPLLALLDLIGIAAVTAAIVKVNPASKLVLDKATNKIYYMTSYKAD